MLKSKFNLDESVLREMYLTRNMKVSEIAQEVGCGWANVQKRLNQYGIRKDKSLISAAAGESHRKFTLTEDEFRDLYLVQGKSMKEVAAIAGVAHSVAAAYAGRFGILKPRPVAQVRVRKTDLPKPLPMSVDELREMYEVKHMKVADIAKICGISTSAMNGRIFQLGLRKRKVYLRGLEIDPKVLRDLYVTKNMKMEEIAAMYGAGISRISQLIHEQGLDGIKLKRSRMAAGYKHNYVPDHPSNVNSYVAEQRLVAEAAIGRHLTEDEKVHHISFDKMRNDIKNLAVLTRKQHMEAHWYTGRLGAHLVFGGKDPGPLVFDQPVFWAGEWVTQIDPLRDTFDKIVKVDMSEIPEFVG